MLFKNATSRIEMKSIFLLTITVLQAQRLWSFNIVGGERAKCHRARANQLFSTAIDPCELPLAPQQAKEKLNPEATELLEVLRLNEEDPQNKKLIVGQVAPSVRVAFSEEFGLEPGFWSPGTLVAALKKIGFDTVLDTNTAADLTVCEEAFELLERIRHRHEYEGIKFGEATRGSKPLPLFTSCCPGWLSCLEKGMPELTPYISSCKSPHMMYGAIIKRYSEVLFGRDPKDVYTVSVMPCVRKRGESDRPAFQHDGLRDVDNVITTQDLGKLMRLKEIDPTKLKTLTFDSIFTSLDGTGSGAGQLFGATGGVMEAAVRTAYELVTGEPLSRIELEEVRGLDGVKEATIPLFKADEKDESKRINLKVAVANGLGNAKKLVNQMSNGEAQYDFVEVMACPGGCIAGGGQPRSQKDTVEKRLKVIYDLDRSLPRRKSHENPTVQRIYNDFLNEYGSERAHELLHIPPIYGATSDS